MLTYFLGANTRNGFYSLYDSFPPDDAFLHVIKGGPGTGKSSLMRRIAQAGEAKGLAVHRVLCSGDPDSLDGVFLPALGQAWVDGTAPHVLEPRLLGVSGDYLDLGSFLFCPFSAGEKAELRSLQEAYREKYRQAYALLASCPRAVEEAASESNTDPVRELLDMLPTSDKAGPKVRLFRSAVSCKGLIRSEELPPDWKRVQVSTKMLQEAIQSAAAHGCPTTECLSPLDPALPEAILLPEEKICLELAQEYCETAQELLRQAVKILQDAKNLHDRMESFYREHMDFDGIGEMTERLVDRLFG